MWKSKTNMHQKSIKVWDVYIRAFHWLLVISIVASWITIELRQMQLHELCGYFILFLLITRLCWGVIGSSTARFARFIKGPLHSWRYLISSMKGRSDYHTGHNPAGAWMVIAFIIVLGAQIATGLLSNNDVGFSGALADQVSKDKSDRFTELHGLIFNLLLMAVWLHLVAVFFYVLVKNQNLIKAMITGKKPEDQTNRSEKIRLYGTKRLLPVLIISAIPIVYLYCFA